MTETIEKVETFIISIPRETLYLGPLGEGESINSKGYLVRKGNRTIYPTNDCSVVTRITTSNGTIGWGETYGICAPQAVCNIIDDLLAPELIGRNPFEVSVIWEDLYDQMHVRGFFGGFYVDAITSLDIALWDICGKITGQPVSNLLGGRRNERIPAYISGLPADTIEGRCELAKEWQDKGFNAFKFAAVVSHDGIVQEMAALRKALGPEADIMIDMHWKYSAAEAASLIKSMEPYNLYFAEAPCAPEDIDGLAEVARKVNTPVASGEEWRTVYEALPRLKQRAISIIQPEMGHAGITQYMRIAHLAQAHHCKIMPHASIGIGIFQAASLQVSATILNLPYHEYQHSVFDKNLVFVKTDMKCEAGYFHVPDSPGLGIEPSEKFWEFLIE